MFTIYKIIFGRAGYTNAVATTTGIEIKDEAETLCGFYNAKRKPNEVFWVVYTNTQKKYARV